MRWWFALVLLVPLSGCAPSVGARMQAITPRPWLPTLCTTCKPRRVETTADEAVAPEGSGPSGAWHSPMVTTHWLGEPLQGIDPYTLPSESKLENQINAHVHFALQDLAPEHPAVWAKVQASSGVLAVEVAKPSLDALSQPYASYLSSVAPSAVLDPVATWAEVEIVRAAEFAKLRPRAAEQALHTAEASLEGWCKAKVAERLPNTFVGPKDATFLVERVFMKRLVEGVRDALVKTLPAALVDDVTTRARARVLAATRKVKPKPAP